MKLLRRPRHAGRIGAVTSLSLLLVLCGCVRRPENVVLITLDTTRADRLGAYGWPAARTPNIDRLADEGVLVEHAQAAAPITLPSHSTMLTGLLPPAHGVRDNGAYSLAEAETTLPERLQAAGFATRAWVSAVVLDSRYGLDQGFDDYDDDLWQEEEPPMFMILDRPGPKTAARVVDWIGGWSLGPREPFFLWVHFFDPHMPWEPGRADRMLTASAYDAEIAQADRAVGMVVEALRAAGTLENTLVVLTADHGESLGEHGEKTHAIFVYDATVRVPMIVRGPGLPHGKVYHGPVHHADLVPTILSALGLPGGEETQGRDLWPALRGTADPPSGIRYSESLLSELGFGMAPLHAVTEDGWKFIRAPRPELYDLRADPRELRNRYTAEPDRARHLSSQLDELLAASERRDFRAAAREMNEETLQTLRSLGYLASAAERESMGGIDPKDGIMLYRKLERARDAARIGDWEATIHLTEDLLEEMPGNVSARNVLALALWRSGDRSGARDQYLRSLESVAHQPRVHMSLGGLALQEGDLDLAERHYHDSLELSPGFVVAMAYLGLVESSRGDEEAAREWYRKATDADPEHPHVQRLVADFYYEQGEYRRALELYRQVLEVVPDHFPARVQSGLAAWRAGDRDEAREHLQAAVQLQPESWVPRYNLACFAARAGDEPAAFSELEQAVDLGLPDVRMLQEDPDLDLLRRRPPFRDLLERARSNRERLTTSGL